MLIIKWQKLLSWKIKVSWAKNAALKIMPAAILLQKVTLRNVPNISDVNTFCKILQSYWVKTNFQNNILKIDSSWLLLPEKVDKDLFWKIRASIMLISPILYRLWKIKIPVPWWCNIWERSIDWHLKWLKAIWYKYKIINNEYIIDWKTLIWSITLNAWFSVTTTENLIIANVLRKWKTTIMLSAIEPHVMNLISFLRSAWANIFMRYNHTIIINWIDKLKDELEFDIIPDYIESWTYMIIGALASEEYIDIENACINDLYSFIEKMKEAGVKFKNLWWDILRVYKAKNLKSIQIQTNIFPWFPTDLQSPLAVLMTQSSWISKIHEILFERRLNFLVELEKMKANVALLNPHEALIFGKTNLKWWVTVTSWDLRAWAAMVIAWLIAKGETYITNVEYIHRGYEDFVEKLRSLWADIREIE